MTTLSIHLLTCGITLSLSYFFSTRNYKSTEKILKIAENKKSHFFPVGKEFYGWNKKYAFVSFDINMKKNLNDILLFMSIISNKVKI